MENERGMIHHRLASPSSCQKAESLGKEAQRSLEIVHPPGKHSTILSLPYLRNYPLSFTLYSNLALSRVPQSTLSALRLEFLPPFTPPPPSLSSSPIELARIRFRKPEISIYASLEIKRTAGSRKKILFLFVCLPTRHEGFVNWAKLMCGE